MASLSADLNSYLKRTPSSNGGAVGAFTSKLSSFKLPTLSSLGGQTSSQTPEDEEPFLGVEVDKNEESGWFGKAKSQENSWMPSLSKKQRILGFMTSLLLGAVCFGLAVSFLPMLVINPRKFSLLFSLGSVFTISSFSFLYGPYNHLVHLFTKERLPFTVVYLSTLIATLYFAMGLQSAILTPIAAVLQVIALTWFVISYIPGGKAGLSFFTKLFTGFFKSSVNRNLPV